MSIASPPWIRWLLSEEILAMLGVASVALLGHGMLQRRRARATVRCKPVPGKLVWSMMEEREMPTDEVSDVTMQYRPDVRYKYKVGGAEYEGTRIYFGAERWRQSRALAQPLLDKYPAGRELKVFYDPANPSETVLERGSHDRGGKIDSPGGRCGADRDRAARHLLSSISIPRAQYQHESRRERDIEANPCMAHAWGTLSV